MTLDISMLNYITKLMPFHTIKNYESQNITSTDKYCHVVIYINIHDIFFKPRGNLVYDFPDSCT